MRLKIFITLMSVMALFMGKPQAQESKNLPQYIKSVEAEQLLTKDSTIRVVDVRTPMEFEAGHVKTATNINISSRSFAHGIANLDKDKVYLVYCRTSNRSGSAVRYMIKQGFKHLYLMQDGFSGWSRQGLPVEK